MKSIYFIFLFITSIFTSNSCSSLDLNKAQTDSAIEMMNSWLGSTKKDLLLKWGAPDNVTSDGNGGEILTYYKYDKISAYNTVLTRRYKYSFFVDSQNKIYYGKYSRETL